MSESKIAERNIPGMNRHNRFVEVEHAENVGDTLNIIAIANTKLKILFLQFIFIPP